MMGTRRITIPEIDEKVGFPACHQGLHYKTNVINHITAGHYCRYHRHDAIEVVYHPKGAGTTTVRLEDRTIVFKAGSVVVYPPRAEHDQRMTETGEDLCILITLDPEMKPWPQAMLHIPDVFDPYILRELVALSSPQHLADPAQRHVLDLRCLALCAALAAEERSRITAASGSPGERHVREAVRQIETKLSKISGIGDIAQEVGVGGEHLRHLFALHTGTPLSTFLAESRVRRATELLAHSTMSLKRVAEACGFSNERYFCTAFRKSKGVPPGRWRTEHARQ